MRAGEFAWKHQISQSTLAYYVKQGLLLPAMVNGKYDFQKADDDALRMITELKGWQFSLDEIAAILSFSRLSEDSVYSINEALLARLVGQKDKLLQEKQNIEASIIGLTQTIEAMHLAAQAAHGGQRGMDVRFLPYLYCPVCGKQLTIHLQTIDAGDIFQARLSCDCGYAGAIEDGIVVNGQAGAGLRPYQFVNYPNPNNQGYSAAMRNHLYQVYNQLLDLLNRESLDNKIILETHISSSSFILQRAKAISPNALYYLCDPLLENIRQEKKRIEESGAGLRICHIASNYHYFPIQPSSVDVIIDSFLNVYFSASQNDYMFPHWKRYLRAHGKIIGVFIGVKDGSKSARQYKALYPPASLDAFNFSAFKAALAQHGFAVRDERAVGPITKSYFSWHQPGDELVFYCYSAEME